MPRILKDYITVKRPGGAYYYFRPSLLELRQVFPTIRLSDDPGRATVQAKALKRLTSDAATVGLYRAVGAMLKEARGRARREEMEFSLEPADVFDVLSEQQERCAVSGVRLDGDDDLGAFSPRLVRIRRDAPFCPTNMRIVCAAAGAAIDAWGVEDFTAVAKGVVARARGKRDERRAADDERK